MRYDLEIVFDGGGVLIGDGTDVGGLAQLGRVLIAFAEDREAAIGIEGGRTKYVGDIQSIRVEANR